MHGQPSPVRTGGQGWAGWGQSRPPAVPWSILPFQYSRGPTLWLACGTSDSQVCGPAGLDRTVQIMCLSSCSGRRTALPSWRSVCWDPEACDLIFPCSLGDMKVGWHSEWAAWPQSHSHGGSLGPAPTTCGVPGRFCPQVLLEWTGPVLSNHMAWSWCLFTTVIPPFPCPLRLCVCAGVPFLFLSMSVWFYVSFLFTLYLGIKGPI